MAMSGLLAWLVCKVLRTPNLHRCVNRVHHSLADGIFQQDNVTITQLDVSRSVHLASCCLCCIRRLLRRLAGDLKNVIRQDRSWCKLMSKPSHFHSGGLLLKRPSFIQLISKNILFCETIAQKRLNIVS